MQPQTTLDALEALDALDALEALEALEALDTLEPLDKHLTPPPSEGLGEVFNPPPSEGLGEVSILCRSLSYHKFLRHNLLIYSLVAIDIFK